MRPVLASEELPSGVGDAGLIRRVSVGARDVLLARLPDGTAVAFGTECPHQGTPLEEASLWDGKLRCRRHFYLYDPRTGENLLPTREARPEKLWKLRPGYLPVFRVEERDGWIWVAEDPEPPPPAYDPKLERPPAQPGGPSEGAVEEDAPAPPAPPRPRTLRVRVGKEFELRLPVPAFPGHDWEVTVSEPRVEVVASHLEPGDDPRQRLRLRAVASGEARVSCAYVAPWDPDPKEAREYLVQVVPPEA